MAVTANAPDTVIVDAFNQLVDYSADTFIIILLNSYTFDSGHDELADVSSTEIATGNGYTQQTEALTSVQSSQTGGTYVFDAANVTWTASGGSIGPATDAEIYNDTSTNDRLTLNIDFGASETANDGSNFQINFNASGIFTGAFA